MPLLYRFTDTLLGKALLRLASARLYNAIACIAFAMQNFASPGHCFTSPCMALACDALQRTADPLPSPRNATLGRCLRFTYFFF